MARGKLIALCGGEGGGKSTQMAVLARHFEQRRQAVLMTREPGGTPEGQHLRKLLLTASAGSWTPLAEMLLMVADRAQHVEQVIAPALAAGTHVITDRFVLSTLSYQGAGRGVPTPLIRDLHRQACGDLWPDLTLIFDIDPAIGLARSKRRLSRGGSDESRFEALDLEFHRRVRAAFINEAASGGRPHAVIDATRPVADIAAEVMRLVDAVIGA